MERPETIENRWDILYRDYADVYEEFCRVRSEPIHDFGNLFGVEGKEVVEIGSGPGDSTLGLAKNAVKVIGIEPEESMLEIARENLEKSGRSNVEFKKGRADDIPLPDKCVDIVVSLTGGDFSTRDEIFRFVTESGRIIRSGGMMCVVNVAPGWYGGELAPIIFRNEEFAEKVRELEQTINAALTELGFEHEDIYRTQYYESVGHAVSVYGFIFGKHAIDHIREYAKTNIKWSYRISRKHF